VSQTVGSRPVVLRLAPSAPPPWGGAREYTLPGAPHWPSLLDLEGGSPPDDFLPHFLYERYCRLRRPWYTRLPVHYHRVAGGRVRAAAAARRTAIALRRALGGSGDTAGLAATGLPGFPGWPIEPAIDAVRFASGLPDGLWPGGRTHAVALSHDLDSGAAWEGALRLARLEEGYGLRSCWNVVGRLYPVNHRVLDRLASAGHEIGLHGYDHRGVLPWLHPVRAAGLLAGLEGFCRRYDVRGYRSPSLFRTEALYAALPAWFDYDSSVPDTERFTSLGTANGACTVYPFRRGRLVVLPLTMPQDAWLMFMGLDTTAMLALWRRKLEWIAAVGGLVMVNTHPDPWFSGGDGMAAVYGRLLELLTGDGSRAWHALPRHVAARADGRLPTTAGGLDDRLPAAAGEAGGER